MIPKTVKDEMRKPAPLEKKDTVLNVGSNGEHTVQVSQDGELVIRRTKVYACALVVITIVCFAGTLTALALVFDRIFGLVARVHPISDSETALIAPTHEPAPFIGSQQPIKIDDVFPKPGNFDLAATNGTDDINIDFGESSGETGSPSPAKPNGNEVAEQGSTTTETTSELPEEVGISFSSSDHTDSSSEPSDYTWGRNWLSSSFPYDGFYMRGETGEPPEPNRKDEESHPGENTSGDGDLEDEASGESNSLSSSASSSEPYVASYKESSGESSSSSLSEPYVVSE